MDGFADKKILLKITACTLMASMTAVMLSGCSGAAKDTEPSLVPTTSETETEATTTETSTQITYTADDLRKAGVNELNSIPILMYHRVYGMTNAETEYTGGNVDKDGYNRTSEAF